MCVGKDIYSGLEFLLTWNMSWYVHVYLGMSVYDSLECTLTETLLWRECVLGRRCVLGTSVCDDMLCALERECV